MIVVIWLFVPLYRLNMKDMKESWGLGSKSDQVLSALRAPCVFRPLRDTALGFVSLVRCLALRLSVSFCPYALSLSSLCRFAGEQWLGSSLGLLPAAPSNSFLHEPMSTFGLLSAYLLEQFTLLTYLLYFFWSLPLLLGPTIEHRAFSIARICTSGCAWRGRLLHLTYHLVRPQLDPGEHAKFEVEKKRKK